MGTPWLGIPCVCDFCEDSGSYVYDIVTRGASLRGAWGFIRSEQFLQSLNVNLLSLTPELSHWRAKTSSWTSLWTTTRISAEMESLLWAVIHPRAFWFRLVPGVWGRQYCLCKIRQNLNSITDLVPGFLISDWGPRLAENYKVSGGFAQKLELTRSQISPEWDLKHHCRLVPPVNILPPSFAHSVPWNAPSPNSTNPGNPSPPNP